MINLQNSTKNFCHLRRDSQKSVRASTLDPFDPVVRLVREPVFKVPVIASVGEIAERIVSSDSITTPTRDCNAEVLNVTGASRKVDTIDIGVDGHLDTLDNAGDVLSAQPHERSLCTYLP